MPRLKRKTRSVRLNLEIKPQVRKRLDRLRDNTDAETITEVFRRALAVYETLIELSSGASKIVIRQSDGSEIDLILIP